MFEKLQAGVKIHDAPRQPRTCSHPIYAQTLTGVCQAIRMIILIMHYCVTSSETKHSNCFVFKLLICSKYTICNQDTQCSSRKRGARITVSMLKGRTKLRFSYLCSSVMSNMNNIKFIVEIPSTQGKPQSKFKEIPFNHSLDTVQATKLSKKFLHFFLILTLLSHTQQKSL